MEGGCSAWQIEYRHIFKEKYREGKLKLDDKHELPFRHKTAVYGILNIISYPYMLGIMRNRG